MSDKLYYEKHTLMISAGMPMNILCSKMRYFKPAGDCIYDDLCLPSLEHSTDYVQSQQTILGLLCPLRHQTTDGIYAIFMSNKT